MKNGRLTIRFEKGEVVGISTNAGLTLCYAEMLKQALEESTEAEPTLDVGIKVTIFGAFLLEAAANDTLRSIIVQGLQDEPDLSKCLWDILKRSRWQDKFRLFKAVADPEQEGVYAEILTTLQGTMDLRGRLAHFKDEDEEVVALPIDNPDLVQQLSSSDSLELGRKILEAYEWTLQVEKSWSERKGIRSNSIPVTPELEKQLKPAIDYLFKSSPETDR
jgi:hypothetical protein